MSDGWLIVLPASESAVLAQLRLWPGVSVLANEDGIHVAGEQLDEEQQRTLLSLPALDRFLIQDSGVLFRPGERTPSGVRPEGNWIPIRDCVGTALPVARIATARVPRVELEIVPATGQHQSPGLLMTTRESWIAWGSTAPQARLERLAFAASDDGRILVRGTPLPPVPGDQLVEQDDIAVPAGWTWRPAIDAESIRRMLDVAKNSLLVLNRDASFEVLAADDFVPAHRSAIRATGATWT